MWSFPIFCSLNHSYNLFIFLGPVGFYEVYIASLFSANLQGLYFLVPLTVLQFLSIVLMYFFPPPAFFFASFSSFFLFFFFFLICWTNKLLRWFTWFGFGQSIKQNCRFLFNDKIEYLIKINKYDQKCDRVAPGRSYKHLKKTWDTVRATITIRVKNLSVRNVIKTAHLRWNQYYILSNGLFDVLN